MKNKRSEAFFSVEKQEKGRSMVEMLGVLAVVGVLTIGGIGSYAYAMDKHRANELVNEAYKRAVIFATDEQADLSATFGGAKSALAGGQMSNSVIDDDGIFGIVIENITKDVCKKVLDLVGDKNALRDVVSVSGTTLGSSLKDTPDSCEGTVAFVFNDNLDVKDLTSSGDDDDDSSDDDSSDDDSTTCNCATYYTAHKDDFPCCKSLEAASGGCTCVPYTCLTKNYCGCTMSPPSTFDCDS